MVANAKLSDYKTPEQIEAEYERMLIDGMG